MVLPSRENAIALESSRGSLRRFVPSGENNWIPSRASQASQSPAGDHSSGIRHVGAPAITFGVMFAPTPTMAGCQGRSRCISPAMELPSGDQVGATIYSLASRMGAPPTIGSIQIVVGSPVAERTKAKRLPSGENTGCDRLVVPAGKSRGVTNGRSRLAFRLCTQISLAPERSVAYTN